MTRLMALDVAILPPPDVWKLAVDLSAALPPREDGLQLGPEHLPHITLTQQFIGLDEIEAALERIDPVVSRLDPLRLHVSGGGKGSSSVWMRIERTADLLDLHERLMTALEPFERAGGTAEAFADGDARPRDVSWVSEYRSRSSHAAFDPHITLGHGDEAPVIEPVSFEADTIGACQLGRFCSCCRVLRRWTLGDATGATR